MIPKTVVHNLHPIDFIQNIGTGTVINLSKGMFVIFALSRPFLLINRRLQRGRYVLLYHASCILFIIRAGTTVFGNTKRTLSEVLVPVQLWVISRDQDGPPDSYTIENTASRTFLDIPDSMFMSCLHVF